MLNVVGVGCLIPLSLSGYTVLALMHRICDLAWERIVFSLVLSDMCRIHDLIGLQIDDCSMLPQDRF